MGSAEPRSFSRGKRAIAGNLVFIQFDRDALLCELGQEQLISKYKANDVYTRRENGEPEFMSVEDWDKYMSSLASPNGFTGGGETGGTTNDLVTDSAVPVYADELLPFDITISLANEYGQKAIISLFGVELLNEGLGFSIDSVSTEKAYTFVCRSVETIKSLDNDTKGKIYSTW